jgi:hypothetical protein
VEARSGRPVEDVLRQRAALVALDLDLADEALALLGAGVA